MFDTPENSGRGKSVRIMCWPHVHRNVVPQLKSIKTISAKLGNEILADIVSMQGSVLNKATFRKVYSQMEEKYKNLVFRFVDYEPGSTIFLKPENCHLML